MVGCAQTQNYAESQNEEEQIKSMIREFYTVHNEIMSSDLPDKSKTDIAIFDSLLLFYYGELFRKLDSLNSIYCTETLRKEAKTFIEGDYGHDLLTDDRVGIESNSDIKVVRDSTDKLSYIVSFLAKDESFQQKVILRVKVVKENEVYKIDSVKDFGSYRLE